MRRRPSNPPRAHHGLASLTCSCKSLGAGLLCPTCLKWHALWLRLQQRSTDRALAGRSPSAAADGGTD